MSEQKRYWLYDLYLKLTSSKPTSKKDLDEIEESIGDEILNTKIKEEPAEDVEIEFYLNYENYEKLEKNKIRK